MIISSSAAQRHCSKVLQMPQLQNHRAQATMRLQFQQQQPPVTRLLHPRHHRTAAAYLLAFIWLTKTQRKRKTKTKTIENENEVETKTP